MGISLRMRRGARIGACRCVHGSSCLPPTASSLQLAIDGAVCDRALCLSSFRFGQNFRTTSMTMTPGGVAPRHVAALNYTLPVAPSAPYMLRISLSSHGGGSAGSYVFNKTVDGVAILSNVDLYSLVTTSKLYFQDIHVTSSASSNMLISFTPVIGNHSVHS